MKGIKMKFTDSECAVCGKAFSADDDVVVCPRCGTPHHRSCYTENGGCANEALHESGFEWHDKNQNINQSSEDVPKADDALICPKCGCKNEHGAPFCQSCGMRFTLFGVNLAEKNQQLEKEEEEKKRLENGTDPSNSHFGLQKIVNERVSALAPGITEEQKQEELCGHKLSDVISFVFYSAKTYVKKFRSIRDGKKLSFNWAAFFFCPYWFYYRRMYKQGIIFHTLSIILSMLASVPATKLMDIMGGYTPAQLEALSPQAIEQIAASAAGPLGMYALIGFAALIVSAAAGLCADKMYYKYVKGSLDEIKAEQNENAAFTVYARKSGIGKLPVLLAFLMTFMLSDLITLLFGG